MKLLKLIKPIFSKNKKNEPKTCWDEYEPYIKIHPDAIIDPASTIKIYNLPNEPRICLEIGKGSHVFANFAILRPDAKITIGQNCQIGSSTIIAVDKIDIEDDVIISWGCLIMDSDNHSSNWEDRRFDVAGCRDDYINTNGQNLIKNYNWNKVKINSVLIKSKAWLGADVKILKGVIVGEGAIVGAGSVVRKSLPKWTLSYGNPCMVQRNI